jgi:hypothetical protein
MSNYFAAVDAGISDCRNIRMKLGTGHLFMDSTVLQHSKVAIHQGQRNPQRDKIAP